YILMRKDGEWQAMGTGVSAGTDVLAILVHSNGDIYVGGNFTAMSAVPNTARIARWNGTTWETVGGAGGIINDGGVLALAEAPNGDVYVGGTFTNYGLGPTICNRILRWDISVPGWVVLNAGGAAQGLSGTVNGIDVDANGVMYCCGNFTQDMGVPVVLNYVARYDPAPADVFSALTAAPGVNARTYTVEIDLDGVTVYFGGRFTTDFGGVANAYEYVIQYNPAPTNTFQNMAVL
ncbi:unnamed protein product, partial [marine sediment metagenome]